MPGSIRLFVISGIPVRLHFSFLILIAFLAFLSFSGKDALMEALVILTLFGCVILHELGHAMVARLYGVRTLEIVMFLIGGVARLERAMKPREELWVALAGPAVNIFIAASLFGVQRVLGHSGFLSEVMMLNLGLAAFNMLPAFPMDGGRVLRSILSMFFEDLKATQIAAAVGRILAVAMGIFAIWQGPLMLLLVAFFVFTGAQQEYMGQKSSSLMKGALVREAMIRNFISLPHGSTFQQAAEQLLDTSQQEFPVVQGNQPLGLLRRDALLTGLAQHGPNSYISSAMERDFLRVSPNDALEDIFTELAAADYTALVMEGEELIGLLTQENLNEFLVLRNLGHRRPLAAPSIETKPIDS